MNPEELNQSTATTSVEPDLNPEQKIKIEAMIEAGVLRGRKRSSTNPKMSRYIFGTRRGIDVFDLVKTLELLEKAEDFLKKIVAEGKTVLVVGTKPATRDLVKSFADKFNFPYVNERWLGGTLTNHKTISLRLNHLKKMRSDKEAGEFEKYTKKERLMFDRELEKLVHHFGGIESLTKLPDAVLIIDTEDHFTVVNEARRANVPIVGLINSNGNPASIQYPIPANDSARSSVAWILDKIESSMTAARQEAALKKVAESNL